jgi:FAD:protein FMN transferase
MPNKIPILPFFFLILFLYGCSSSPSEKLTVFSGTEMTIAYRILIGLPLTPTDKNSISKIIFETFNEVNQIYNKWNPDSELSRLNQLKAGVRVPLSGELLKLILLTDEIVRLTEKRFDPTIEPLQALWKEYLEKGQTPSPAEIESIAQVIGWSKIHYEEGLFFKDYDATSLDLGGIAKGYCVDLLVERLNKAGFANVFVEWGGEIRASGEHPDQRPWNIFISRLGDTNPENAIAILSLQNQAIATSGDYLQNWTIKDEGDDSSTMTYFHVIDPFTLHPRKVTSLSVASASVVANSCAWADGLATAAMMFSNAQEAQAWADEIQSRWPKISFWIISRS